MKKIVILAALGLCVWLHAQPAEAAYVTGADLSKNCQSSKSEAIFSCLNYIAGIIDYHVMMQSLGTAPSVDFCLPETLPITQAGAAVMEYLRKSPQHDSFIAAPAVMMALHEAYPCAPVNAPKRKRK